MYPYKMNSCKKELNPLIKWSGGKKDELNTILPHVPALNTIDTYLEPFVGGGSLFFRLSPQKAVINDIHSELIDFYRCVKDGYSSRIYDFMKRFPNNEETYYRVRRQICTTPLEIAQRFYYLRKTCFRGMLRYNAKGEFNIPFGKYKTYTYEDLLNKEYENLLQRTEILNTDFEDIFRTFNNPDNFMFLDPPYDSTFTDYGYCTFGTTDHERLARCFKETRISCMMVIGYTPFIEELYEDYIVDAYPKKYRFKIHSGRIGSEIDATHLIIKNFF